MHAYPTCHRSGTLSGSRNRASFGDGKILSEVELRAPPLSLLAETPYLAHSRFATGHEEQGKQSACKDCTGDTTDAVQQAVRTSYSGMLWCRSSSEGQCLKQKLCEGSVINGRTSARGHLLFCEPGVSTKNIMQESVEATGYLVAVVLIWCERGVIQRA